MLLDKVRILVSEGNSEDEEEFILTLDGERIILGRRKVCMGSVGDLVKQYMPQHCLIVVQ